MLGRCWTLPRCSVYKEGKQPGSALGPGSAGVMVLRRLSKVPEQGRAHFVICMAGLLKGERVWKSWPAKSPPAQSVQRVAVACSRSKKVRSLAGFVCRLGGFGSLTPEVRKLRGIECPKVKPWLVPPGWEPWAPNWEGAPLLKGSFSLTLWVRKQFPLRGHLRGA